ncbi:MAG: type II toxin-antitoxin system VapC family toxin [Cyanobium sp.]
MTGPAPTGSAYLLDSHVLLWWWFDPSRLSAAVHDLLIDPSSEIRVSAASVWELSLEHHRGKLPELAGAINDLPGLLQADDFQRLPISLAHGLRAGAYSQPHRDPFDWVLAAQAELERLVLLTADSQLSTFPCQTLW